MENPLSMEILIGESLVNGPFSITPCLITRKYCVLTLMPCLNKESIYGDDWGWFMIVISTLLTHREPGDHGDPPGARRGA